MKTSRTFLLTTMTLSWAMRYSQKGMQGLTAIRWKESLWRSMEGLRASEKSVKHRQRHYSTAGYLQRRPRLTEELSPRLMRAEVSFIIVEIALIPKEWDMKRFSPFLLRLSISLSLTA